MKRYGSSNNLADDFTYNYYSGTNKLQSVFGSKAQYTYDANGNMTMDDVNKNYNILYDHRNLMTDIRTIRQEIGIGGPEDKTYWTIYKYDEAGNRIRKITYKYTGSEPDPVFDENGDNPSWDLVTNEFYVRDVSGKEIAIYNGSSLTQWNVWGLDNVGKINADTTRNYYLKDHLGSIRVVLNSTNTVISAQDYDAWGYPLENRTYNAAALKYEFTGKERDNETNYDYFGARYYDSRIGRWGGVEPLLNKYVGYSPYIYSFSNPIIFSDVNGKDITVTSFGEHKQSFLNDLSKITGLTLSVNESNKLVYDKSQLEQGNLKGSLNARNLLLEAINDPSNISLKITKKGISYTEGGNIFLSAAQITQFMENAVNLDESTMGWGLTLMHELLHALKGMPDDPSSFDEGIGEIETLINEMRKQLGERYGQRMTYIGLSLSGENGPFYVAFNPKTLGSITEARNKERQFYAKMQDQYIEYK